MLSVSVLCCAQLRSHVQLFVIPRTVTRQGPLSVGFSTGVGCKALLQGLFPTQGLNPGLSHCMQILRHLSLCWFLLHSKVNQSHVYLYTLFLDFPSHLGDRRAVSTVPVLRSKFSVVIHFVHSTSSVCPSAPVSQLIPPSRLPACCL